MRLLLTFAFLAATGIEGISQEPDDRKAIQGPWRLDQLEGFGQVMFPKKKDKDKKRVKSVIEFKGDKMFFDGEGAGTFSIDPAKSPKRFDCIDDKTVVYGIYKIEKDTLTICWSSVPKGSTPDRPDEFTTYVERPKDRLLILKRIAK